MDGLWRSLRRLDVLRGPHVEEVVVATASEVLVVWGPLETADLLGVTSKGAHVVLWYPHVMVVDVATAGTAGGSKIRRNVYIEGIDENLVLYETRRGHHFDDVLNQCTSF